MSGPTVLAVAAMAIGISVMASAYAIVEGVVFASPDYFALLSGEYTFSQMTVATKFSSPNTSSISARRWCTSLSLMDTKISRPLGAVRAGA